MIDTATLDRLALELDPSLLMRDLGFEPDPWQARLLRSRARRVLLLASRQCGKSTTTGVLGLHTALCHDNALVLLVSPSQRQSGELFVDKVRRFYDALGRPVPATKETETTLTLANGSRVVSLPGSPDTIRSYSDVHTVIVDEAALADDEIFTAVSPMRAVGQGRLILLSSPKGQRGYFFDQWEHGGDLWERYRITADDCPRITAEFLEGERRTMGELMFTQEYYCDFIAANSQYFSTADVLSAFDSDVPPLFG